MWKYVCLQQDEEGKKLSAVNLDLPMANLRGFINELVAVLYAIGMKYGVKFFGK